MNQPSQHFALHKEKTRIGYCQAREEGTGQAYHSSRRRQRDCLEYSAEPLNINLKEDEDLLRYSAHDSHMVDYRSFQGDLSLLSAVNLFQLIGLASLSGQLEIRCTDNAAQFIFNRGKLNYGFSKEGHKKIGQILIESKLITTDQLEICLKIQKASEKGQKLGSIAVGNGFLLHSQILEVFYKQTEKALFQALTWSEGRFSFVDSSPLHEKDIVLEESIESLLMKGLISIDLSNWASEVG